jgi:hypothetical protein
VRRREFISLLSGVAVSWPVSARAQQKERMRRVGALMHTSAGETEAQARLAAFLQGLQEAGWSVGRNVQVGDPLEHGRSCKTVQGCGAAGGNAPGRCPGWRRCDHGGTC